MSRLILLLSCFVILVQGNSTFGTIATGSQTGTYIKVAKDISSLLKNYKIDLHVLSTKGSLENLDILAGKIPHQKASWAIVQNDALEYYRFLHFKDTREDISKKIKTILPLYNEHIHIFTKKGKNIKFERGGFLKVAVPSIKSGASISAHMLENAFGIRFKYVYANFKEAQKYLQEDVVDIFIDVIALPSNTYKNITGLDLVSIPQHDKLEKLYISTNFSKKDYQWLDKDIQGYKIPSVIVTNQVDSKYNVAVNVFVKAILKNYNILRQNGHPKWSDSFKNLNLDVKNMHPIASKILNHS